MTNIFSFNDLVDKFRIKYDPKIEDAFWLYVNNKKVKVKRLSNRIYGVCPGTNDDKKKQLLQIKIINTIDENKNKFTKHQQEEAKRAR